MLSTLAELTAFACFVTAGWMVDPVLGLILLGLALLVIGWALDGVDLRGWLTSIGAKVRKALTVKAPKVKAPRASTPEVPRVPTTRRIASRTGDT